MLSLVELLSILVRTYQAGILYQPALCGSFGLDTFPILPKAY